MTCFPCLSKEQIKAPERFVYINPLVGVEYFEILVRQGSGIVCFKADLDKLFVWAKQYDIAPFIQSIINNLTHRPHSFAGLSLKTPLIMGIVNATPDSFANHGQWDTAETAKTKVLQGADLIDVGGESTRPYAETLDDEEEAGRVLPLIEELIHFGAKVSVDTRKSLVMAGALQAGVHIINDISALTYDPCSLDLVSQDPDVCVVLTHAIGASELKHSYTLASLDVFDYLNHRIKACEKAGIFRNRICIDPGLGFGKTKSDNCEILSRLGLLKGLGCTLLVGASRKRFIGEINRCPDPCDRLVGSISVALGALNKGGNIIRVHDVLETRQALAIWQETKEF